MTRQARNALAAATRRLLAQPAGPPAVMLLSAIGGLLWANVDAGSYHNVFDHDIDVGFLGLRVDEDLHGWINDGAMTLFFFAVGLEIKRELVVGELQSRARALLPVVAALGGMIVPAGLYLLVNIVAPAGDASGWAVPVATDIAFTLGVLSLLGERVPVHLRLFVLALAIVDDVGGVVIIAVAFSDGISTAYLAASVAVVALVVIMRQLGMGRPLAYVPAGVALWYCAGKAGIEPTIAGVALGLLTPARPFAGTSVLEALEHRLAPITALVVLPAFAVANTGIAVSGATVVDAATGPVGLGIIIGLVAGKALGITLGTLVALRSGIGELHPSVPFTLIPSAAVLCGIGFTVAIFVADLSFDESGALDEAKIAILVASALAACAGALALRWSSGRTRQGVNVAGETLHNS